MMERSRSKQGLFGGIFKRLEILERDLRNLRAGTHTTDWISLALVNSWINYGGIEETAQYWKSPSGNVYLKGVVKSGAIPSIIGVLPPGYRPLANARFAVVSNGAFGYILIDNLGNITVQVGNNTLVDLHGVVFAGEA